MNFVIFDIAGFGMASGIRICYWLHFILVVSFFINLFSLILALIS